MKKLLSLLLVGILTFSILAGCSSPDAGNKNSEKTEDSATENSSAEEKKQEEKVEEKEEQKEEKEDAENDKSDSGSDTIVFVEREIHSTYDPCIYPGSNHYVKNGAGELLFRIDVDGSIYPSLAKSGEQVDDHTWMIELRPEAKFWSGEEVTAEKVVGSLERSREKNTKATSTLEGLTFNPVEEFKFEVKTDKANDPVLLRLAHYELCILNPDLAYDSLETMDMTGMYKIVEFTPKEKIVLVRNEDYYGKKPKIKNVVHEEISDQETRSLSVLSGHADIAMQIPNESIPQLEAADNVKLYSIPAANTQTIYLNLNKPYLSDVKVRQALAWGLDREELILVGTEGKSFVTTNWLSSSPKYKDIRNAVYEKYDFDKASSLLDEAGYTLNSNNMREKDGEVLKIQLRTWGQDKALGEAIQSQWSKLGIDCEVIYGDYSLIETARENNEWDASIEAWSTYGEEHSMLATQYMPEGTGNHGGYNSPEVISMLDELLTASNEEEVMEIAKAISIKAAEDAPGIYICPRVETTAVNAKLKGFIEHFRNTENGINADMEFTD
ncbi:MAG: ABC transporter substrate-binding protein [Tissierellia bacterium]|nr:ABC transporter substrate-binding protein [Tissierellia bacterium]